MHTTYLNENFNFNCRNARRMKLFSQNYVQLELKYRITPKGFHCGHLQDSCFSSVCDRSIMKRKYDLIPSTVCFSKAGDNHQAKVVITQYDLFQILTFEKHDLQQNRDYYRFSPCLSMKFFCSLLTLRL